MTVEIRVVGEVPADADARCFPVSPGTLAELPEATFLDRNGFTAEPGSVHVLPPVNHEEPARVLFGDGAPDVRTVAAAIARATRRYERVAIPSSAVAVGGVVEGFLLGAYHFSPYRSEAKERPAPLDILVADPDVREKAAVELATCIAQAVMLARDLGNEPGGTLTPAVLAERARAVAEASGLACDVWDRERIVAEGLGGLLGVNRGSVQDPRLVRLEYAPADPTATVALVGKGVTFDSGGLTLKPITMMFDMKLDMSGAGAVLSTMSVLRDLDCPVRVVGWMPLTDNMSGGDAMRLGDVLRTRNGTTVEVINADAEGRLLLADGLALAAEEAPDCIVDIATLTDTIPMAAGRRVAGLFANDDAFQQRVLEAAGRAGESVWPMPRDGIDKRRLDSKIADLVNTPHYRYGQSALAAIFLREFVPDAIPWAHLDIAGPAYTEDEEGVWVVGATGYGVRTLIELLVGGAEA
jgi:leucyl aminopeptidase